MTRIRVFLLHYRPALAASLMALGLLRLALDLLPGMPIAWVLAALIGLWLGLRWNGPRWTLWGVILYLVTPFPIPRLALAALSLLLVGLFNEPVGTAFLPSIKKRALPLIIFVLALGVYLLTLSPGLLPADAGEFQVVAAKFGIAHPPGYPLYTVLAGIFAHLPGGTAAWYVNFFSALVGALTVALVAFSVHRETKNAFAGWLTGITLATAHTVWLTATQASVRPLTLFFAAALLEAMLAYRLARRDGQKGDAALIRFGLAAGLGVTHHGSLFFLGCVLALGIATADWRNWRRWWLPVVAALSGLLPIAYLPLRHDGFLAPDYITTLDGLRYHVLAEGFASDMFALAAPEYWAQRIGVMLEVFRLQWPLALFGVIVLAWLLLLLRDRWLALILGLGWGVHSFVAGTYRAPQIVEYAMPAYLLLAVTLGWGVAQVLRWKGRWHVPGMLLAALTLGIVLSGFSNGWTTARRLASTEEARDEAELTLDTAVAADDGVILSNWHRVTPIWYLQEVEGRGTDVPAYYVAEGPGDTPMETWALAISDHVELGRQVVVTQQYRENYRYLPYTAEGDLFRVQPRPLPDEGEGVAIGDYRLLPEANPLPQTVIAGTVTRVRLRWALGTPLDYGVLTTFVHFGAVDAPPLAQVDLPVQINAAGAVDMVYELYVPETVPPGTWSLLAGAYTPEGTLTTAEGAARVEVGTVEVLPANSPAPTAHPLSWPVGDFLQRRLDPMARLIGWDYDTTLPGAPRLYLHWWLDAGTDLALNLEGEVTLAAASARTDDHAGYWTSALDLPPGVRDGLKLVLTASRDGEDHQQTFNLPQLPQDSHYVLYGGVGALVDWSLNPGEGDRAELTMDWLPAGATYNEILFDFVGASAAADGLPPITSAIPTTKWAYNRVIRSQQTLIHVADAPLRLVLYDGFSGRSIFVVDSRLTAGSTGVSLTP